MCDVVGRPSGRPARQVAQPRVSGRRAQKADGHGDLELLVTSGTTVIAAGHWWLRRRLVGGRRNAVIAGRWRLRQGFSGRLRSLSSCGPALGLILVPYIRPAAVSGGVGGLAARVLFFDAEEPIHEFRSQAERHFDLVPGEVNLEKWLGIEPFYEEGGRPERFDE